MVDSATSANDAVVASCSLLHSLIEELAERLDAESAHRAAAAIEAMPLPAAVFSGTIGSEPLSNAPWRATLGAAADLPPGLVEAMRALREPRSVDDLEVQLADRVAYFTVALRSLRESSGTVIVCAEITDQVVAAMVGMASPALIWRIPVGGAPTYYGAAWRSTIGGDWPDVLHDGDVALWSAGVRKAERAREPVELEVRLRVSSGAHRWHRVRVAWHHGDLLCGAVDVHEERGSDNELSELAA